MGQMRLVYSMLICCVFVAAFSVACGDNPRREEFDVKATILSVEDVHLRIWDDGGKDTPGRWVWAPFSLVRVDHLLGDPPVWSAVTKPAYIVRNEQDVPLVVGTTYLITFKPRRFSSGGDDNYFEIIRLEEVKEVFAATPVPTPPPTPE